MNLIRLAVLLFAVIPWNASWPVELPDGYRGPPYKAPTPWTVPGAKTLHFAEEVQNLMAAQDVLLVNVSPVTLSPPGSDGHRIWILSPDKAYTQIPGSIWLPNVGYQSLDAEMMDYFREGLQCHGGSVDRALLLYCTADCWMSWNAVIRVTSELNYRNVYWYPFGVDGWLEAGLSLEPSIPEPFPACSGAVQPD